MKFFEAGGIWLQILRLPHNCGQPSKVGSVETRWFFFGKTMTMAWWWFQIFCGILTPIWGKTSHFDSYFSTGLKPPSRWFLDHANTKLYPSYLWPNPCCFFSWLFLVVGILLFLKRLWHCGINPKPPKKSKTTQLHQSFLAVFVPTTNKDRITNRYAWPFWPKKYVRLINEIE